MTDPDSPTVPNPTRIAVSTTNAQGDEIAGYYVTLWQNGAILQSGFSPVEFSVDASRSYQIAANDYGSYSFNHWIDESTGRFHDAAAGDSLTAVYTTTS